jgi:acyl-coenzyme A synthetase/AMP-(fatty) acid ligase/tetratricopeptide (TPR) repeat protein/thioesterase domain-containing protein
MNTTFFPEDRGRFSPSNGIRSMNPLARSRHLEEQKPQNSVSLFYDHATPQGVTYDTLKTEVGKLARYISEKYGSLLRNTQSSENQCVAIFLPQSIQYIRCFLALYQLGIPILPLSPTTPISRLIEYIKRVEVVLLMSDTLCNQQYSELFNNTTVLKIPLLLLDTQETLQWKQKVPLAPADNIESDRLAYIVNTSGSTGRAKQIRIARRGISDCIEGSIEILKIQPNDKIAAFADVAFDAHIFEMLIAYYSGASLYVVPSACRHDLAKLVEFYNTFEMTVAVFVPSMLRHCRPEQFTKNKLRLVISTGEKIDDATIEAWRHITFVDGYGPAENTIATWLKTYFNNDISINLIRNTHCYVRLLPSDEQSQLDSAKERGLYGELLLAGPGLALGYVDSTLNYRFREIQVQGQYIRVYFTGDLVHVTSRRNAWLYGDVNARSTQQEIVEFDPQDENMNIVGRIDGQKKISGRLVCPEEVTAEIQKHLKTNVFVEISHEDKINAYIDSRGTSQPFNLVEIYKILKQRLGQIFIPQEWIIIDSWPLLESSDKTDTAELKKRKDTDNTKRIHHESELSEIVNHSSFYNCWSSFFDCLMLPCCKQIEVHDVERALGDYFRNILNIPAGYPLFRESNFFYLGAKSIHAVQFLQYLHHEYNITLGIDELSIYPTIDQLALIITRKLYKAQYVQLIPIFPLHVEKSHAGQTPIFLIHTLMGDAKFDYRCLVNYLGTNSTNQSSFVLFGISARGISEPDDMDNDLVSIAYDYYQSIKKHIHQKGINGPKVIAGWSLGGVLALLIQQFFESFGDFDTHVFMIDSESPLVFQGYSEKQYAEMLINLVEKKIKAGRSEPSFQIDVQALAQKNQYQQIRDLFNQLKEKWSFFSQQRASIVTIQRLLWAILKLDMAKPVKQVTLLPARDTVAKHEGGRLGWGALNVEILPAFAGDHDTIMLSDEGVAYVAEHLQRFCKQIHRRELTALPALLPEHDSSDVPNIKNLKHTEFSWSNNATCMKPNNYVKTHYEDFLGQAIQNDSNEIIYICGITGSGKTTLAKAVLFELFKDERNYCYLLNAENMDSYERSLRDLAVHVVGDVEFRTRFLEYPPDVQKFAIQHILQQCIKGRNCIFVLDNLNIPNLLDAQDSSSKTILDEFRSFAFAAKIIVTSQSPYSDSANPPIDLSGGFKLADCKTLVQKHLGRLKLRAVELGSESELEELIKDVNNLPLALDLAGKYLYQENNIRINCTISGYRELLSRIEDPHENANLNINTQHAAIWISVDRVLIGDSGEWDLNLCQLMCFVGFLHGDHISLKLIDNFVHVINHGRENNTAVKKIAEKYIRSISDFSLLQTEQQIQNTGTMLHMHRCVQGLIKTKVWKYLVAGKNEQIFRLKQIEALNLTWKEISDQTPKNFEDLDYMLQHVDAMLSCFRDELFDASLSNQVNMLRVQVAKYLSEERWDAFRIFNYLRPFVKKGKLLDSGIEEMLKKRACVLLSDAYLYVNPKMSEIIICEFEAHYKNSIVEDNYWDALQLNLAIAYTAQHQWNEARDILRPLLQEQRDDELALPIREALGRVCYQQSNLKESETIFTQTLRIRMSRNDNARNLAHTEFELGVIARLKGNYDSAIEYLSAALEKIKPLYQTPDLGVAHVLNELGRAYLFKGQYGNATKSFDDSLSQIDGIKEEYLNKLSDVFDTTVPFIMLDQFRAWNIQGLGDVLKKQLETSKKDEPKFEAAHKKFEEALGLKNQVYEYYHDSPPGKAEDIDIAVSLLSLGQLWFTNDIAKSEKYVRLAREMMYHKYGGDYVDCTLAEILYATAQVNLQQGDIDNATAYAKNALSMYQKIFAENMSAQPSSRMVETFLNGIAENRQALTPA